MNLFTQIIDKCNEGGPFFTYPILIVLFIIIGIFIYDLLKKKDYSKTISLISHLGWFAVAWGFWGRTIGLIAAFDSIEAHGEITIGALASGLKIALLDPVFGIFVFIVARIGIIALTLMQRKEQ
ncbi:MAG: MotA/TolQ/ExbB proton channel family protein [Bacteroidetes bacterium]|nr:MotA/TolQ/ExbB proton channel family protein [Bacteroidota bacterium]